MLISQPISRFLTNHSELCMSRLLNNQPRRISIYILQRRPSFGFESSVSSTPMTSGDPVGICTVRQVSSRLVQPQQRTPAELVHFALSKQNNSSQRRMIAEEQLSG